ncbi:reverse transcriptase domain-containing protein [Nonomuraea antimicrobica]|uniref:reverse transcriptase domain-containing protein n=1 Tax=Nonomuraea antimicrobica TaxID=561173 RepID=UPI0031E737E7
MRAVEIPKQHGGGMRMLGIPTVADRVAQTVVARHLGIRVDPVFHEDSYGYRPGKSALDAVERCRQRCWKRDWVIDLDIQKFFDSVRWDLVVKAVEAHGPGPFGVPAVGDDTQWTVLPVGGREQQLGRVLQDLATGPLDGFGAGRAQRDNPDGGGARLNMSTPI